MGLLSELATRVRPSSAPDGVISLLETAETPNSDIPFQSQSDSYRRKSTAFEMCLRTRSAGDYDAPALDPLLSGDRLQAVRHWYIRYAARDESRAHRAASWWILDRRRMAVVPEDDRHGGRDIPSYEHTRHLRRLRLKYIHLYVCMYRTIYAFGSLHHSAIEAKSLIIVVHQLRKFTFLFLSQHGFHLRLAILLAGALLLLRFLLCASEVIRLEGPLADRSIDTDADNSRSKQQKSRYLFKVSRKRVEELAGLGQSGNHSN